MKDDELVRLEDIDLADVRREALEEESILDLENAPAFTLKSKMVTLKISGQYRKKLVDDGCKILFRDCWNGKAKGLICVFEMQGISADGAKALNGGKSTNSEILVDIPLTEIEDSIHEGEFFLKVLLGIEGIDHKNFGVISEIDQLIMDEEAELANADFGIFG